MTDKFQLVGSLLRPTDLLDYKTRGANDCLSEFRDWLFSHSG